MLILRRASSNWSNILEWSGHPTPWKCHLAEPLLRNKNITECLKAEGASIRCAVIVHCKKHISACGGDDDDDREYDPASVTVILMMMLIIFK